jgi:hypothetical protein
MKFYLDFRRKSLRIQILVGAMLRPPNQIPRIIKIIQIRIQIQIRAPHRRTKPTPKILGAVIIDMEEINIAEINNPTNLNNLNNLIILNPVADIAIKEFIQNSIATTSFPRRLPRNGVKKTTTSSKTFNREMKDINKLNLQLIQSPRLELLRYFQVH